MKSNDGKRKALAMDNIEQSKSVSCPGCPKKFSRTDARNRHFKYSCEGNPNKQTAKRYGCKACKNTYSTLQKLHEHERIHGMKEKIVCDLCNKEFVWKSCWDRHLPMCTKKTLNEFISK